MAFATSQEDDSELSDINITPLVDVMLVLLGAFVITIPVLTNAVHVNLPKTVTTTPPDEQKAVTVTVDDEGKVFLNNTEVARADLERQLQALLTQHDLTTSDQQRVRETFQSLWASAYAGHVY